MSASFEGKVAMVTGGAGGLGAVLCKRLAEQGVAVGVADVDGARAETVARDVGGLPLVMDMLSSRSVNDGFAQLIERYGRVDILINNAAIHLQRAIVNLKDEDFESIIAINLKGAFFAARAAARQMMRQKQGGRIINIVTRLFANPLSGPYMASKFGLWGLTGTLAMELASNGITVNAVAPGVVRGTGMEKWFQQKAQLSGLTANEFDEAVVRGIPLGRTCQPDDVAEMVLFLCSDKASYITGELLNVTGGWTGYAQRLEGTMQE